MKKTVVLLILAFVAGGLLLPHVQLSWHWPQSQAQVAGGSLGVVPGAPEHGLAADEIYARAAQAAHESVVNIDTTQRVRVRNFMDDDFFGFGNGPRYRESLSKGSGVIITRDGYVLTNEHVVGETGESGRSISVTLSSGKKLSGTVVGADHQTDVALVKVDANELPAAHIGTVRGLIPGQMVVAIGDPLGLGFSVTHGVVSALDRPVQVQDRIYSDLIQHDALINPGNSGGALVNIQGQVIGINTLVAQDSQGIGFAIPIDTALHVADELKQFGKIKRPWLGLAVSSNSPDFVSQGVTDVQGAVVRGIYRGGPAENAELQAGDVITRIGNRTIHSQDDFKAAEKQLRIGQQVDIEIARGDQRARGNIKVGEAP